MPHTLERGRFYIGPNGFPRFAGSSSGVFLADTVRTEVTGVAEDTGIEDAFVHRNNEDETLRLPQEAALGAHAAYLLVDDDFLAPDEMRGHLKTYFTIWHPLFPFLDGAYLIQCFDNAVAIAQLRGMVSTSLERASSTSSHPTAAFPGLTTDHALVLSAIFKSISSTVATTPSQTDSQIQRRLIFESTDQALMYTHLIVTACQASRLTETFALQGILAIQIYLFSKRKMRPAMHLSGLAAKLAYEGGLHRCPERFHKIFKTSSERDMRKRVFYSLYVLDRLLSAEFGIPIMLNDTDIDTCIPGDDEKHVSEDIPPSRASRRRIMEEEGRIFTPSAVDLNVPDEPGTPLSQARKRRRLTEELPNSSEHGRVGPQLPVTPAPVTVTQNQETARRRLLPAYSLIHMARMIGRAMEIFNKSVDHRTINGDEVLALRAELDSWWNDIDFEYDDISISTSADQPAEDPRRQFATLFTCLYQQQIINLNRPTLSLSPSRIEHAAALQSTIAAVRVLCSTLSAGLNNAPASIFWPGFVDMVFFGSLILVYGSRRDAMRGRPMPSLPRDLRRILRILEQFNAQWGGLKALLRIVKMFLSGSEAASTGIRQTGGGNPSNDGPLPAVQYNVAGGFVPAFDPSWNAGQNGPAHDNPGGDFHFDFEAFELNPESLWAYHVSIPGSPVW